MWGKNLQIILRKKKSKKINDLLWDLPYSFTDRSEIVSLNKLEVGKIVTIKIKVIKYNFLELETYRTKLNVKMNLEK